MGITSGHSMRGPAWRMGGRRALRAGLLLAASGLAAQKVVLVTGEYAPYATERGPSRGVFTEIVTAVFDQMKLGCEIRFAPWKRAEATTASGEAFAAFPYAVTEERKQAFGFSVPVMSSPTRFFFYKPSHRVALADWKTYDDLKAYRIGGVIGYFYEKEFRDAGLTVDYAGSDELNFRKLRAGRVDLIPINEWAGRAQVDQLFPGSQADFQVLPRPIHSSDLCLMISRAYPGAELLTVRFNEGLKALRASGRYAKILKSHGMGE